MPEPKNKKLYEEVKDEIYKKSLQSNILTDDFEEKFKDD